MYYPNLRSGRNTKNAFLVALLIVALFLVFKGCSDKENYNKERKDLNKNIDVLQNRFDSLEKISNKLVEDYGKYQLNYVRDSVTIDSLSSEIKKQINKTAIAQNKANFYINKLSQTDNSINKLENNKTFKTGNDLLKSLSGKTN